MRSSTLSARAFHSPGATPSSVRLQNMQMLRGLHHGGLTRSHARPVAVARPAHSRNRCLSVNAHASKPTKAQVAVVSSIPGTGPLHGLSGVVCAVLGE